MKGDQQESRSSLKSFGAKSDYVNQLQEETNLKRSKISKMKQNMDNIDNVLGVSRLVSQSKPMDSASPTKSEAVSQNRGKPFPLTLQAFTTTSTIQTKQSKLSLSTKPKESTWTISRWGSL